VLSGSRGAHRRFSLEPQNFNSGRLLVSMAEMSVSA
jgi:hypothetical protein